MTEAEALDLIRSAGVSATSVIFTTAGNPTALWLKVYANNKEIMKTGMFDLAGHDKLVRALIAKATAK